MIQRNHARYDHLDKIWHLAGAWRYVFPFAICLVMGDLTRAILPGAFEEYYIYITYCLRTSVVRLRLDSGSVLIGMVIFPLWVGLEGLYPVFSSAGVHYDLTIFDTAAFGFLILARFAGSVLVAPLIGELFCRSFLIRYAVDARWQDVPIGTYARIIRDRDSVLWFLTFQVAFRHPDRGTSESAAIQNEEHVFMAVAHATANLLLLVYVVYTGEWGFL